LIAALGAGAAVPPGALEEILSAIDCATDHAVDVDEWEQAVYEYGQQLMVRPTGALIGDLTAEIIAVGRLLDRTESAHERTGLLRVSAGLSGILAIELGDAGEERSARIAWGTARRAADASGDRDLRVWTRGRAAEDAFWTGRSRDAVAAMIAEAVAVADGVPSAGLARAHAAAAYMAADQEQKAQALGALNKIKSTFERLPDGSEQTVLGFRESQLVWAEAYVYTQLGEARAHTALARASALYPPGAQGPLVNLNMMKATAVVRSREVDTGLLEAVSAVQDRPDAVTAGTRHLAKRIVVALPERARELPAARQLQALTSA
jgi:hypothetical protein